MMPKKEMKTTIKTDNSPSAVIENLKPKKTSGRDPAHFGTFEPPDEDLIFDTDSFIDDIFADISRDWNHFDIDAAPRLLDKHLSELEQRRKISFSGCRSEIDGEDSVDDEVIQNNDQSAVWISSADSLQRRWFVNVNIAALPFHHLIAAASLSSEFITEQGEKSSRSRWLVEEMSSEERRRRCLRSLISAGTSISEAALFDKTLERHTTDIDGNRLMETDWEVSYFDELEGCAELYLAEMMVVKRRIYRAGEDLRTHLEIPAAELDAYLDRDLFEMVAGRDPGDLFCHSLRANFALTVSGNRKFLTNQKQIEEQQRHQSNQSNAKGQTAQNKSRKLDEDRADNLIIHQIDASQTFNSRRVAAVKIDGKSLNQGDLSANAYYYRVELSTYWLDWQRTARRAKLDFDLLATLTDARTIRFYELTKLWRAFSMRDDESGELTATMTIKYTDFAALLPLPRYQCKRAVTAQIRELIRPLKASGYVKSFSVKEDWRHIGMRDAEVVFRFRD